MSNGGFLVELSTMSDNVTGSCTLVTLRLPDNTEQTVLIDCGMFLEKEHYSKNGDFHFNPKELDACVVTHAHIDHIGRLPLLLKEGYTGPIFCSKVTGNIIPISLEDNFQIMRRESKNGRSNGNGNGNGKSNGNGRSNGNGNGRALYEEIHVELVTRRLKTYNFEQRLSITPNMEIVFLPNGHLFGAALVYLRCTYRDYKDINIIFTGDYKKTNKFFKTPKRMPFKLAHKRMNIVSETTYGASMSTEIEYIFFNELCQAIEENRKILLPTFSLGRTQEVLLELKRMQEEGHLPYYYKIYCDGSLGKRYLKLAREGKLGIKKNKNFIPNNFHLIGECKHEKAQEQRRRIISSKDPAIIVSSSGNGSYGPSNTYLRGMLNQENVTVIFTGYCTEGTVGRVLVDTNEHDEIEAYGETFVKKANVLSTKQFSAHAYADELLSFIAQFNDLGSVVLTHGNIEEKENFSGMLEKDLLINSEKIDILKSETTIRLDSWGLVNGSSMM